MKSVLRFAAASVLLLVGALGATAQSASGPPAAVTPPRAASEPTSEELNLQDQAMGIVTEEATDLRVDFKLMALAGIREMVDNGTVAKNSTAVLDTLAYLSEEGSRRQSRDGSQVINNFPEVRREACNLLGRIGGKEADVILMRVMFHDNDPIVLSEAAYALGKIGLNEGKLASQHIALAVTRVDARLPDNNFAYASLLAFEKLARKNNGLDDVTAVRAIMSISQGAYVNIVKQKALQLLSDLKKY